VDGPAAAYARALAQVALGDKPDVSVLLDQGDAFARTGRAWPRSRPRPGRVRGRLREIVADFASRIGTSPASRWLTLHSCWSGWQSHAVAARPVTR